MSFFRSVLGKDSETSASSCASSVGDSSNAGSSESTRSSGEDRDTPGEDPNAQELDFLRKRKRTEKARAASLLSKALKRKEKLETLPSHPADPFREDLRSSSELLRPGIEAPDKRRRLRLLWSWFASFTSSIMAFLRDHSGRMQHAINVCIIDDTNMRLSLDGPQKPSRVVSCMNNTQTVLFNAKTGQQDAGEASAGFIRKNFIVHTPLVPLPRANARGLASEFCSWIFAWLGCIGERFLRFGAETFAGSSPGKIPIQCLAVSFDSVKTNLAVLKGLRNAAFLKHRSSDTTEIFPLLSTRCGLHQVALSRKQILFYFSHHWSSIVRLGHLFEANSFRLQFGKAMLQVINANFVFVRVAELPDAFSAWQKKRKKLGLLLEDMPYPGYGVERLRTHQMLAALDNGEVSGTQITHWCVPGCSCGGSKKTALLDTCRHYSDLFLHGFPVPLTYRWLHAHRALRYCKDIWQRFRSLCFLGVNAYTSVGCPVNEGK